MEELEDVLPPLQDRGLSRFLEIIDKPKTRPDGTLKSQMKFIDELAALVVKDISWPETTIAIAAECREMVRAGRKSPMAVFQLGSSYGMLLFMLGPNGEAARVYYRDWVAASHRQWKLRQATSQARIDRDREIIDAAKVMLRQELPEEEIVRKLMAKWGRDDSDNTKSLDDADFDEPVSIPKYPLGDKRIKKLLTTARTELKADKAQRL